MAEDFELTDELMDMDAAAVSHTPPPVTIAATLMPEGTPSTSRACPKKKNSLKTPKCGKKTPSWYDHNVDPFKYVFKKTPKSEKERRAKTLAPRVADEPSTEPRTASKRLDFDDPPQV
ncbi:hypothetical protein SUGI_0482010 [Cryptomeria japonica]|nr:hypothetical protein SUGI_0482010 [Cryptomeria japonica]